MKHVLLHISGTLLERKLLATLSASASFLFPSLRLRQMMIVMYNNSAVIYD